MRNIRLRLQYEGTRYQGWQKQTSTDNTIQGKMEACGKGHLPALTAPLKNESALAWILCMRKEVADTVRPQLNFSRFSPFI